MAWVFLLILVAWPVMEFAAFAQVAAWVGTPLAILGLFLSAALGFAVLRGQSFSTARKVQTQLNQGQMPMRELFDNAAGALAGLLLIIPGYVTDLIGLLLLLPPVRALLYGEMTVMIRTSFKASASAQAEMRREEESHDSTIIEAEYKVVGQTDADPKHPPHDRDPPSYGGGGGSSGGAGRPSIRLLL